jgi:hypothetical protein
MHMLLKVRNSERNRPLGKSRRSGEITTKVNGVHCLALANMVIKPQRRKISLPDEQYIASQEIYPNEKALMQV